ncbi:MAG: carboxypeptidase-like regulatory domain-containing protein [Gemmatimonadota bacterium]
MRTRASVFTSWGVLIGIAVGASTLEAAPSRQASQAVQIQGVVVDQMTGSPLVVASVSIEGTSVATTTSREGRFSLMYTPSTDFTLVVTMMGYKPHRQT